MSESIGIKKQPRCLQLPLAGFKKVGLHQTFFINLRQAEGRCVKLTHALTIIKCPLISCTGHLLQTIWVRQTLPERPTSSKRCATELLHTTLGENGNGD